MKKQTIKILGVGVLLLVIVLLSGSNKEANIEEAVSETTAPELAADYPASTPIYPGTTVESTRETETEESKNFSVQLSLQGDSAEVINFYKEALTQDGWNYEGTNRVGNYSIISGTKENLRFNVQVIPSTESDDISLSTNLRVFKDIETSEEEE